MDHGAPELAQVRRASGAVIVDTNVLKYLEDDDTRERVVRSLAVADLRIWPSAMNALEVVRHENPRARGRLLRSIRELIPKQFLLPMPLSLLKSSAEALLRGQKGFTTGPSHLEWLVREPERIEERHVLNAGRILDDSQRTWDEAHRAGRKAVRALLKSKGVRDPWGSAAEFLDRQWTTRAHLDSYIEAFWRELKLEGDPPIDLLLSHELWRLYFEGLGATVYERTVLNQSPKPAHSADVIQLVYMAGTPKRLLVTEDQGLTRLAQSVLLRRYPMTRILTPTELLSA
jgi:hypothetical protein